MIIFIRVSSINKHHLLEARDHTPETGLYINLEKRSLAWCSLSLS